MDSALFLKNASDLSNLTTEFNLGFCKDQIRSYHFYNNTRKINIFMTILIIFVGLLGNGLAVFVFAQKRFRLHSSSIYLLFLAISDGLFLMTHFFEDTLRTYIDTYLNVFSHLSSIESKCLLTEQFANINNHSSYEKLFRSFNITDRFNFTCCLVNFFRYFLRFFSAYIIVIFTIQRAVAINSPLFQKKIESKKSAWLIVLFVFIIGIILNLWVPFMFSNQNEDHSNQYCDINKNNSNILSYFIITIAYIILIILIPIVVIFVFNSLIIYRILKAEKKREGMVNKCFTSTDSNFLLKTNISQSKCLRESTALLDSKTVYHKFRNEKLVECESVQTFRLSLNPERSNSENFFSKLGFKTSSKTSDSQKITRMLLIMSMSYAILNIPYFISWCLFFNEMSFNKQGFTILRKNYYFGFINLTEIFYVSNYGIHFFIYCASGRRFRTQLKNAFKP